MSLEGQHVVVIGAGIGGLTFALAARRAGADVTVLEQAEKISEVGAGLQISPNGVLVLEELGLLPAFEARAVQSHAVNLRNYRDGAQVLRLDLDCHAADQKFYCIHRADLIDVLADAVRSAGVQVRLLQQVCRVDPNGGKVHLANDSALAGDVIVGADGLHSRARTALNGADDPFFTGQVAWRTVIPNPGLTDEVQLFMGPGQHMVCYPLRGGELVNIVAVQERREWAAEGWYHRDEPNNLRAAFSEFGGQAADLLGQVNNVSLWGLFRHPVAPVWQKGNVALLGDAAHPTLPFMAQGAVMAMEDAWVLANCLSQEPRSSTALRRYQQIRRDRAVRVIAAANDNAWKYHMHPGPLRGLAHLGLRIGGLLAPARMVRQFDWIYRHDVRQSV